jgi:hypothetical protein
MRRGHDADPDRAAFPAFQVLRHAPPRRSERQAMVAGEGERFDEKLVRAILARDKHVHAHSGRAAKRRQALPRFPSGFSIPAHDHGLILWPEQSVNNNTLFFSAAVMDAFSFSATRSPKRAHRVRKNTNRMKDVCEQTVAIGC